MRVKKRVFKDVDFKILLPSIRKEVIQPIYTVNYKKR